MKLVEERAVKEEKLIALNAKVDEGQITIEERAELTTLLDEIETIDRSINDEQRLKDALRPKARNVPKSDEVKMLNDFSFMKVVRALNAGKDLESTLDGSEKELYTEGFKDAKERGVDKMIEGFPVGDLIGRRLNGASPMVTRGLDAATAATAANLIQTGLGTFIPALYPTLKLDQLGVQRWNGLVGNLDIPGGNAISAAAYETETSDANETTPSTKKRTLSPKRLAAWTEMTLQMLTQSSINLESWVINNLIYAEANKLESVAYNGGGSNEPIGILAYSSPDAANVVTLGPDVNTGAVLTRGNLLQAEYELENANAMMGMPKWVFTPAIKQFLKNLQEASGSGQGFVWKDQNTVIGYDALSSNLLPKTLQKGGGASNCHAAILGDWSNLVIGYWGIRDLTIDNITKKKQGKIDVIMNSFNDVEILQPAAFTIFKTILAS